MEIPIPAQDAITEQLISSFLKHLFHFEPTAYIVNLTNTQSFKLVAAVIVTQRAFNSYFLTDKKTLKTVANQLIVIVYLQTPYGL